MSFKKPHQRSEEVHSSRRVGKQRIRRWYLWHLMSRHFS